ncbi:Protein of unknown function (DUF3782) [Orpheovirus IHUMI-LCC2]|uniref:Uncharacterized protein n=1 Tax=Orpheovirus IHUMI-LCC2 TaxID=2023057 RepID=A0A2I2L3X9_9VIRU|nr:Protein of unknown function (DUF3782) [Orpheovirus IHUMI-LCC2]SNW62227.1 Protein of unknown function (DUF3782) [Orpheovirus IHUMI-LCC2]
MNWEVIILDGTLSNALIIYDKDYGNVFPYYNKENFRDKTMEDILERITGVRIEKYKHNILSIFNDSNSYVYVIQLFEHSNNITINNLSSWISINALTTYVNNNKHLCTTPFVNNINHLKYVLNLCQ